METIVLTIHLLLALALIVTVLLQRSEGGGLGIGGGGGVASGRPPASPIAKFTWALAVAFIVTSLALTWFSTRNSAGGSVIDRVGSETEAPADEAAPALPPALGGDLTPPSPLDGPAVPPSE
ncbi:MAG: preprotein translocase subunit SecG [Pseudomonadota bacterium]